MNRIRRTVAWVLATSAIGIVPARAQTPSDTPEPVALGEVVVTGSRIERPNLDSSAPLVSLDREAFEAQGIENFADLAATLPQFAPAFGNSRTQSTFAGAAASGLNTTNLRNLNPVRTVVLLNGRRIPSGSPTSTFADFNAWPTANLARVEILTGGAAAIYGADAVAGVVNLITRKDVDGVEIGASYGASEQGDNENPNGYLMVGGPLGERGRALLTVETDYQGKVSCADRDLCRDDVAWTNPAAGPVIGPRAYSGVAPAGRFFFGGGNAAGYTQRNGSFTDAGGNLIPFVTATDGYNRNPNRTLAIPTRRVLVAAEGEYELGLGVSAFAEANFGSSSTDAPFEGHPFQSNAAGSLFGGGPGVPGLEASIPLSNPFVPGPLRTAAIAAGTAPATGTLTWFQRFSDAGGSRGADNERQTVRVLAGFKGRFDSVGGFGENWSWEVSHVYGRHTMDSSVRGLVGTDRLYYGLRVEPDPAAPGAYRCIDPGARAAGCVPINPFAPYTPAMQAYLGVDARQRGRSTIEDTLAFVSGSVANLPAGPLQVSLGAERRSFSGRLDVDELINRALATGNQIGDTDEITTTTNEAFAETAVPLLADLPMIRSLTLEGAYRRSNPDRGDDYGTWRYGLNWAPVTDVRLRGVRARTVRTPVPGELSGIAQTFGVVNDPCTAARRNVNATRAANCAADGVPVNYAPALIVEQSVAGVIGGNPDLEPEVATTTTYGLVFTPSFFEGFSLTVDRFEIELDGIITTIGRQTKANLCYDTAARLYCGDLVRGTHPTESGPYVLRAVDDQLENVAALTVKGVDVAADYAFDVADLVRRDADWGRLRIGLAATLYDEAEQLPLPTGPAVDLLGAAGGSTTDQGFVRRVGNVTVHYAWGRWSLNWNTRVIGRAEMAPEGFLAPGFPEIGSHAYHGLRAAYRWPGVEVYAGVTNLTDKQPPLFATGASGTQALDTIPAYYDVFGRSYFGGVRMTF